MSKEILKSKPTTSINTLDGLPTKLPPQSVKLEEAVLGAILMESDKLEEVVLPIIHTPDVFYIPKHALIYQTALNILKSNGKVDLFTVFETLKSNNQLEAAGGMYGITMLTNGIASTAHLEAHCRILSERYMAREAIKAMTEAIDKLYTNQDVFKTLEGAEISLNALQSLQAKSEFTHVSNIVEKLNENMIEQRINGDNDKVFGVTTGFAKLDKLTNGWQKSDLIIIAARPAVGKSALGLNFAINAAKEGKSVGIVNIEMSGYQTVKRGLSNYASVRLENLNRPKTIDDTDYEAFLKQSKEFSNLPIYLDEGDTLYMNDLKTKCRRLKNKHSLDLLIIDYLQLMGADRLHKGNREQEISKISRGLKSLAKELDIPIIALSQLSRAVEQRGGEQGKIPQLSDLRESGAIEQDADMVCFIYRPEYHGIKSDEMGNSVEGEAHFIIAKHRNGKLDTVRFKSKLEYQRFEEIDDYMEMDFKDIGFSNNGYSSDVSYNPNAGIKGNYDDTLPPF